MQMFHACVATCSKSVLLNWKVRVLDRMLIDLFIVIIVITNPWSISQLIIITPTF